jgi:[acyl-carrier-protein] S-malonyltransferase
MPLLRAGEWVYEQGEIDVRAKDQAVKVENKVGHRPFATYNLPQWVKNPEVPTQRRAVEQQDYFGMAADGQRNFENWNVAHVAAVHDDLKLLSYATLEQCKEPNKWGMTPTHMCGLGQHPYGPSLNVLYELVSMGVADPEAVNHANQSPWHICNRMHKTANLKKYEKVLLQGKKPEGYDKKKEAELKLRGKFARSLAPAAPAPAGALADVALGPLPVCIVFPGQGSQYVGMMKTLKELPVVADMLERANSILGFDLMELMLNGPEDKLAQTNYCQPAMYVAGLAALEQLKIDDPEKVERCMAMAGLSLGEYTALTAAGVLDFETGLKIVKERGEAMDYETKKEGAVKQSMMSVAGLSQSVVDSLCEEIVAGLGQGEVCQIANFLFPNGFSVAGTTGAVAQLETKAKDAGALQAKLLKTSGAFHTPIMAGAKDRVLAALESARSTMRPPKMPIYMNCTAKTIGPDTPVSEIIRLLGDQLVSPVRWEQSMKAAIQDGCTTFYECGPNKQLKAMMKRIDPKIQEKMTSVPA